MSANGGCCLPERVGPIGELLPDLQVEPAAVAPAGAFGRRVDRPEIRELRLDAPRRATWVDGNQLIVGRESVEPVQDGDELDGRLPVAYAGLR